MGRALIFFVLAAALGAGALALSAQRSRTAADARQAEGQADVLAREIAEAGHNAALGAMVTPTGFADPTDRLGDAQDYADGRFQITYSPGTDANQATVRVTGTYGGAVHTATRTYARSTFDAPGPMWLDVPAATTTFSGSAVVAGGPVALDPRQHEAAGIEPLRPLAALKADLAADAAAAGTTLDAPLAAQWAAVDGPLDGVNAADAAALYRRAVAAKTATDPTLAGAQTVAGTATWGLASEGDRITHVTGDLTVSGRLTGHGALVVDGDLRVPGELDWDGLVIVHGTGPDLVVDLAGDVAIDGMLVVSHDVAPTTGAASAALVDAIRARLLAGLPFGATVQLGDRAAVRLDLAALKALGAKLRFDGDGVRLIASSSEHTTAAEAAAGRPAGPSGPSAPPPPPPPPPPPTLPPDGSPIPTGPIPETGAMIWVCHLNEGTGVRSDLYIPDGALRQHSPHGGDYMGRCTPPPPPPPPPPYNPNTATTPPPGTTPIPSTALGGPPGQKHDVCHWDPVGGYQNKQEKPDKIILHLLHLSDYMGKCTDEHKAIDPLSF